MRKLSSLLIPPAISLLLVGPLVIFAQTTGTEFQDALTELRQLRQSFKDAKIQEASEATRANSQAMRQAAEQRRTAAQQRMEEKRQEVLIKLVDIQIKWMDRTKKRVQRMPNISADLKTQLSSEVDAAVQQLNDLKSRIQGTSGREAIIALAKEVRDAFKTRHDIVKKIVDAIHTSRATDDVATAEARADAIKAKVQELKGQGKNTTGVEAEIADADKKISDARDALSRQSFREANDDLKGAYQKFRSIATKAKGL